MKQVLLTCSIDEETDASDINYLNSRSQYVTAKGLKTQFFLNPKYACLFLTTLYFLLCLFPKIFQNIPQDNDVISYKLQVFGRFWIFGIFCHFQWALLNYNKTMRTYLSGQF